MKSKLIYRCRNCRREEPKWLGRCPQCGEWNTFFESGVDKRAAKRSVGADNELMPIPLSAVEAMGEMRIDSGMDEINRVLGGGIMKNSSILIGGESTELSDPSSYSMLDNHAFKFKRTS